MQHVDINIRNEQSIYGDTVYYVDVVIDGVVEKTYPAGTAQAARQIAADTAVWHSNHGYEVSV